MYEKSIIDDANKINSVVDDESMKLLKDTQFIEIVTCVSMLDFLLSQYIRKKRDIKRDKLIFSYVYQIFNTYKELNDVSLVFFDR